MVTHHDFESTPIRHSEIEINNGEKKKKNLEIITNASLLYSGEK